MTTSRLSGWTPIVHLSDLYFVALGFALHSSILPDISDLCHLTVGTVYWGNRATCVYTVGKAIRWRLILIFPSGTWWRLVHVANSGRPKQMTQEEIGVFPFLLLIARLMPTPRLFAPFGLEAKRERSQPSRQPALDVEVIHKIVELKLKLLNIVRDH